MADYNLQDTLGYVAEYLKAEGAEPNRAHQVMLGNQALRTISSLTDIYRKSWSNAALGGLTLTNNAIPIPTDCIKIERVEFDGEDSPLEWREAAQFDAERPGWRVDTGDPVQYTSTGTEILLSSIPSGATGKVVARGVAYLPDFSDTAGATNPLAYLPSEYQLLPAYYILSMLPVQTVNRSKDEMQLSMERRNTHAAMWDDGIKRLRLLGEQRRLTTATY